MVSAPVPADVRDRIVRLRRTLHRHPELSWEEHETMQRIADALSELGIPHRTGIAETGIVADLIGEHDGPRIALRADTDALPIQEHTGLAFASVHDGVMHACGHDGHASMLVGAAAMLLQRPPPLPVRLLWQPAEEKVAGASAMIDDGVLDGVAMIFGGHVDTRYPPGTLIVTEGAVNASTDAFEIVFRGRQGHGARPHEAVDAIVVASHFVTALQALVSREIHPAEPAVVSVGRFHAGAARNIIAGHAELEGTIRAHTQDVREHLCSAVERIASATAHAHGAEADVCIRRGTPPVINRPMPTAIARAAACEVVGADRVRPLDSANMGGEDFAQYLEHVPGAYIRYGAQHPDRGPVAAHSSEFDIHEDVLAIGAAWLDGVARNAGKQVAKAGRDAR